MTIVAIELKKNSKQKQGILRLLSNADNQHFVEYGQMKASIRFNRKQFYLK